MAGGTESQAFTSERTVERFTGLRCYGDEQVDNRVRALKLRVPVFRKGNKGGAYATKFEYVGDWACEKYGTDESMILAAQEDSPKAIAGVLCMREVKQPKI